MKKIYQFLPFSLFIFLNSCSPHYSKEQSSQMAALRDAYQEQKRLISQSSDTIIGYKAGLTSTAGQTKFQAIEPVAGVLFKQGLSYDRQAYLLSDYKKLMLETEIGFILNTDIPTSMVVPADVSALINTVVPVIELPNLDYPDLHKLTGLDLIATNVASNQVLIGKGFPLIKISLSTINPVLTKNGIVVNRGYANDAMGDQLKALRWLIVKLQTSGYRLKTGDLLITGALGKMVPAKKGQYDADFGQLGHLSFSVR